MWPLSSLFLTVLRTREKRESTVLDSQSETSAHEPHEFRQHGTASVWCRRQPGSSETDRGLSWGPLAQDVPQGVYLFLLGLTRRSPLSPPQIVATSRDRGFSTWAHVRHVLFKVSQKECRERYPDVDSNPRAWWSRLTGIWEQGLKAQGLRRVRAIGLEEALEQMTEEQRALQGWRAGERRKLQSIMAAENIWAFSLSLKKKKDGAMEERGLWGE